MRRSSSVRLCLLAALLAGGGTMAQAELLVPDYALTAPSVLRSTQLLQRISLFDLGAVRLAASGAADGSGLSLEAGHHWFARAGLGRSLESDEMSLGGGYRFSGGDALSMHLTRQLGQERLGLALRYDWQRAYLRLSYDSPLHAPGLPDRLRFSAGVHF